MGRGLQHPCSDAAAPACTPRPRHSPVVSAAWLARTPMLSRPCAICSACGIMVVCRGPGREAQQGRRS